MKIIDRQLKDMFIHILKTLDKRFSYIRNDYSVALSDDRSKVAIYVSYEMTAPTDEINKLGYDDITGEIVRLEYKDNIYSITTTIPLLKYPLLTGMDISNDGGKIVIAYTTDKEYVKVINLNEKTTSYQLINVIDSNILFGYNVLFSVNTELLLVSAPLADEGHGKYYLYQRNNDSIYEDIGFEKVYQESTHITSNPQYKGFDIQNLIITLFNIDSQEKCQYQHI